MLTFVPQTMTTPSRHHGKALTDPFAASNFDFDWESLDNLRLWRWRNRNRSLLRRERQRERELREAKKARQSKATKPTPSFYGVPKPAKRGDVPVIGRSDPGRLIVTTPQDRYLTQVVDVQEPCCPIVKELVSPTSGRNSTGHLVDLYQDDKIHQQFYEVSCRNDMINQPCKFLEGRRSKSSKCIQQHTLTYALVRPRINQTSRLNQEHIIKIRSQELFELKQKQGVYAPHSPGLRNNGYIDIIAAMMSNGAVLHQPWYLDYITIRSGCACSVVKSRRRKKAYPY